MVTGRQGDGVANVERNAVEDHVGLNGAHHLRLCGEAPHDAEETVRRARWNFVTLRSGFIGLCCSVAVAGHAQNFRFVADHSHGLLRSHHLGRRPERFARALIPIQDFLGEGAHVGGVVFAILVEDADAPRHRERMLYQLWEPGSGFVAFGLGDSSQLGKVPDPTWFGGVIALCVEVP